MADEKDGAAEVPAEEAAAPEEEAIPEGCNCKDEFITTPCPLHGPVRDKPPEFVEEEILITDVDLNMEQPWGRYYGHIFTCPKCKYPAIMVNENMGKFCVQCGVKVRVQSKVVTEHIRSLNKEQDSS